MPPLLLLARVASTEPQGNQLGHFEANPKLSAASFWAQHAKARPDPGARPAVKLRQETSCRAQKRGGEGRLEAKNVHRPMPPCNPSPFCIVSPRTALMVPAPYIFVGEATCTWHEETRHLGSGFCVAIGQFWIPSFPVERSPNSDQSSKAIGDMLPVKCARFSWNDRRNRDKENTRETRET